MLSIGTSADRDFPSIVAKSCARSAPLSRPGLRIHWVVASAPCLSPLSGYPNLNLLRLSLLPARLVLRLFTLNTTACLAGLCYLSREELYLAPQGRMLLARSRWLYPEFAWTARITRSLSASCALCDVSLCCIILDYGTNAFIS